MIFERLKTLLLLGAAIPCLVVASPVSTALGRRPHANDVPECVTVRGGTQPNNGYGYDHVVYVRNACPVAVECTVGTRRNPKPEFRLVVPPGMEKGVVTGTHEKKRRHAKFWVTCDRRATASTKTGELGAAG